MFKLILSKMRNKSAFNQLYEEVENTPSCLKANVPEVPRKKQTPLRLEQKEITQRFEHPGLKQLINTKSILLESCRKDILNDETPFEKSEVYY